MLRPFFLVFQGGGALIRLSASEAIGRRLWLESAKVNLIGTLYSSCCPHFEVHVFLSFSHVCTSNTKKRRGLILTKVILPSQAIQRVINYMKKRRREATCRRYLATQLYLQACPLRVTSALPQGTCPARTARKKDKLWVLNSNQHTKCCFGFEATKLKTTIAHAYHPKRMDRVGGQSRLEKYFQILRYFERYGRVVIKER